MCKVLLLSCDFLLPVIKTVHGAYCVAVRQVDLLSVSFFLFSDQILSLSIIFVGVTIVIAVCAGNGCEFEQDPALSDNTVRFWCPELTQEGQWHHLVLIFHRAGIMKNSSVSLFVDGDHMDTQKVSSCYSAEQQLKQNTKPQTSLCPFFTAAFYEK